MRERLDLCLLAFHGLPRTQRAACTAYALALASSGEGFGASDRRGGAVAVAARSHAALLAAHCLRHFDRCPAWLAERARKVVKGKMEDEDDGDEDEDDDDDDDENDDDEDDEEKDDVAAEGGDDDADDDADDFARALMTMPCGMIMKPKPNDGRRRRRRRRLGASGSSRAGALRALLVSIHDRAREDDDGDDGDFAASASSPSLPGVVSMDAVRAAAISLADGGATSSHTSDAAGATSTMYKSNSALSLELAVAAAADAGAPPAEGVSRSNHLDARERRGARVREGRRVGASHDAPAVEIAARVRRRRQR